MSRHFAWLHAVPSSFRHIGRADGFRECAEAGFRQTLARGLFVEPALIEDYDNLPAEGRKKNDLQYLVQLGYKL